MSARTFRYETSLVWTGNAGDGTRRYEGYRRDHDIAAPGRPAIRASSDAAFRGDPARYSPEDLLLAALSGCHMLAYLHLCADAGVVVTGYADQASGRMTLDQDGRGGFEEAVLRPKVVVEDEAACETARQLHEEAHRRCFIAASVNFPVRCEATVEGASGEDGAVAERRDRS